jgi:cob(I)alamin adenosyltransferase
MDFDSAVALCGGVMCLGKKKKKQRRVWTKTWLLNRNQFSHMSLLAELATNEPQDFKNYLRMNEESFVELLERVTQHIEKKDSAMRQSIPAKERLVATLHFLASGRSYGSALFSTPDGRKL